MQAHTGEAAEGREQRQGQRAGRHVVVRAVVDQATQRAALLLADSSCLLVSLSVSGVVPITVPGPCTDACFLRLQAYGPAGAASAAAGGVNKFGSGLSPSPSRAAFGDDGDAGGVRIGQGESPTSRVQELREREAGGKLGGGNGNGKGKGRGLAVAMKELFVVTARPAKGGSCTDLRAWSCADPGFAYVDIELEPGDKRVRAREGLHNSSCGRAFTRLDAPHGLAVKMVASINVLIVYSSSAGKFWVMAGKWSEQTGGPSQAVRPGDFFGSEGYEKKRLLLMKCAVVSSHGPVYSIHVSPLHLILGEKKGVRVWSLRPLIKPGSSGKSSGQYKPRFQGTFEQGSYQSSKKLNCEICGRVERCQHVMESSSALGKIDKKKSAGNEAHSEENLDVRGNMGVSVVKKPARKGLFSTSELKVGANVAGLGNYRKTKVGFCAYSRVSNFEFRSLSELQAALKMDSSSDNLCAKDQMAPTTTGNGGGGVIKNETRNGISRSYLAEHGDISSKEKLNVTKLYGPHGDSVASSAEGFRSDECNGDYPSKTTPRPRNGFTPVAEPQLGAQLLVPHVAKKKVLQESSASVHETDSRVQSRMNPKELDSAGVWFVALNGEEEEVVTTQSNSHAGPRPSSQLQVVDIQGLSLMEYVVLDSKGELHLLTFNKVSKEREIESPSRTYLSIRHLRSAMRVTSFAVLPVPPPLPEVKRDLFSPAIVKVKRKLWISDGMYSVHVVIFPEEKSKVNLDSATTEATLAVSQAVFMKDRVDGLVAGSLDTVVVLTKGKLISYVMPGG